MTAPPPPTVLFAWRRIQPPFLIGGAEVSQQLLAEEFAAAGWRTVYLASHEPPWSRTSNLPNMLRHLAATGTAVQHDADGGEIRYAWNGVDIRAVRQLQLALALHEALDHLAPALVITSQEGSADLVRAARSRTTVAGWLHSVSATGLHVLDGDPHHALATSRFVQSRTPGTRTVLFYPPFASPDPAGGRAAEERDGDLLMVNPVPAKGSELLHRLADLLPDRHFTLVEGWWDTSAEFAHHPNVTYLSRTYDMNALYARHRLLLVPSTVEDAFPRVITEAGLAGLPAIGSARGGIPEAIGPHGLLASHDDPAAWCSLIRTLDRTQLARMGETARRRAASLTRPCLPELRASGVIAL